MENMESKCTGLGRGGDAGLARKTQVLTVNLRMTMRSKMSEPMLQHTFLSLLKHFKALKSHWHRRDYMAAQHMSIQHGPSMVNNKKKWLSAHKHSSISEGPFFFFFFYQHFRILCTCKIYCYTIIKGRKPLRSVFMYQIFIKVQGH